MAGTAVKTTTTTTVFLTPQRITAMLRDRRAFQVVKFRTNCTDCVPNL
ncbi:MAG: hypothetical protein ACM30G_02990 [Micromonosporaceae bacterium]|jgi:hypothetical protein